MQQTMFFTKSHTTSNAAFMHAHINWGQFYLGEDYASDNWSLFKHSSSLVLTSKKLKGHKLITFKKEDAYILI